MEKELIEKYLPIIQKYYQCSVEDIKLFVDGHDHYVLLVNDTKAFRFPRSEDHGKKDTIENILLKELSMKSPIKIQVFEERRDENITYQTYDFIAGVGFSRKVASTFSIKEKLVVASLLGKFLKVVHQISLKRARELHMDEIISPEDYADFFDGQLLKVQRYIFPLLMDEEKEWISRLFHMYVMLVKKYSFENNVTHFDMLSEHIIVDPQKHTLSGVIDFSFRIADPARDFMFFDRYGKEFISASYHSYGEVDKHFDERRKFYALEFPIANLLSSLQAKDEKMIPVHLVQLKEYIREQIESN